ncbi:hypothetical protein AB4037_13350 [Labrys sp. KB_33_2]|uniref:hypothetical protein n=1 Tax=Labrys sp. KB_33_2 TaxID=3237479 RepID=UPI003F92BDF2
MGTASRVISIGERIKGAALMLIGGVIVYFAVDNYLKVSNAQIGTVIRMPRILEWSYDNFGLVPSVILQSILGGAVVLFGLFKLVATRR